MPEQIYVSASQVERFIRCHRLIGFEYVEGIKPPQAVKQKFGSDVHKELEKWLTQSIPPSRTPAGEVALQAIKKNLLPAPSKDLLVEHKFEMPVGSVIFTGFIDCLVTRTNYPIVIDHKTTSSYQYIKTVEDLKRDPQALAYVVYTALQYKSPFVSARWIYYVASNPGNGKRRPIGAKPVEVLFDVSSPEFLEEWDIVEHYVEAVARVRRKGIKGLDLAPNPRSCSAFGGCYFQDTCQIMPKQILSAAIDADIKERGY